MSLEWSDSQDTINWHELQNLYRLAPLGDKSVELLQTVFTNSRFKCFVRDEAGRLVAAGRVLSDGADCAYLCDVAVMPDHQGTGLGRAVVQRLLDHCKGHRKIILYAVPGKEDFYRRLGFMRLLTGMAIFEDQAAAVARGHLGEP